MKGCPSYRLVGSNDNPACAVNQLEFWQADTFAPEEIDKELGWAASIGMNTMRVYLHDLLWKEDCEGYLKASNTTFGDDFGGAVALRGDRLLVGAESEDSSATGTNGDQTDNSASNAGAVYAFAIRDVAPPTVAPLRPEVDIAGRRRVKTEQRRVVLRGTAKNATRVEFKSKRGRYRDARGTDRWSAKIRLVSDLTVIRIRAKGPGGTSRVALVVYQRLE